MAAFEYTAINAAGKTVKGVLEGDNQRQVRQQLREKSLTPLVVKNTVAAKSSSDKKSSWFNFNQRRIQISNLDLTLITRQLATLVKSGMTIERALYSIANQSKKSNVKRLLMAVRAKVLEGHSLAVGFGQFPAVFPEIFRSTIAAGEASGNLDQVLQRLADYMDRQHEMSKKLLQSLIYPLVLILVSVIVVSVLLAYVVPKVAMVFESSQATLPVMTRLVMTFSDLVQNYGIWLVAIIIVVAVLFRLWLNKRDNKIKWQQFLLRLPLWGKISRTANAAAFARTLGILVSSRVAVLDAMRIGSKVMSILPMRDAVTNAANSVKEGQSPSKALAQTNYFPGIMIHLMASGEASGTLSEMLISAADYQDMEVSAKISTLMSLLQPIIILCMGGAITAIMVAVLLPIAQMSNIVA